MKRLALVAFLVLLVSGMAATPAAAAPGPPDHPEWWFDSWNVQGLWASGARGQGITIGEIDTGVNAGLPELSANVLAGTDFGTLGGNGQTDRDTDDFGHGTAMASLMVAHDGQNNILGMAPDAQVLPVAVPITGTTDDAGDQAGQLLLQAIHWAADHGAKIISMSLGSQRGSTEIGRSCPATEQSAVDYALSKGAIVVASGGNSGDNGSPIEDPGVCLGVVSVGAVDNTNTVPAWSSKHPYLTVAAPGVDVPSISKIPGEAFFGDGTSQAAALTSAGLAVIWSKYPQLTNRQVVARLLATLDFKHTTRDTAIGYGVINIGSAVTADVAPDAPNPVYDGVAPFLAQDKALAKTVPDPKVKPATTRKGFPGSFAVTPAPGPLLTGPGLGGVVGGGIGLIAVAFLAVGATRRRRFASPVGYVVDPPTEPIPVITFGAGSPSPVSSAPSPATSSGLPSPASSDPSSATSSGLSGPPSAASGPLSPPSASSTPSAGLSPVASAPLSLPPSSLAASPAPTPAASALEPTPTTAGLTTTSPPPSQLAVPPTPVESPTSVLSPAPDDSPTKSEPSVGESSGDGGAGHTSSVDTPEPEASPVDPNWHAVPPVDTPGPAASPLDKPATQPAAPTVDSPSAAVPSAGESSMTRVDSPGGSGSAAGDRAPDDAAQSTAAIADSPSESE